MNDQNNVSASTIQTIHTNSIHLNPLWGFNQLSTILLLISWDCLDSAVLRSCHTRWILHSSESSVPPEEAFGRRPCSWICLCAPTCTFCSCPCLYKCNVCVIQRRYCVLRGADVLLRAADVAFNLRGNAVISIPWTRRRGTAARTFSLEDR